MEGEQITSISWGRLQVTKYFAQGGSGIVYETSNPQILLKLAKAEGATASEKNASLAKRAKIYETLVNLGLARKKVENGYDTLACLPSEYLSLGRLRPAILMKRASGITLGKAFREDKLSNRPLQDKLALAKALVQSVRLLHSNQVVHADIKPENFMWDEAQFRLAMLDVDSGGYHGPERSKQFYTFQPSAIPDDSYQSPELVVTPWVDIWKSGTEAKRQPDLWALATMLYQVLVDKDGPFPMRPQRDDIAGYVPYQRGDFFDVNVAWPKNWQISQINERLGNSEASQETLASFQRVFQLSRSPEQIRPSADRWARVLANFPAAKTFQNIPTRVVAKPKAPEVSFQASGCPHCGFRFDKMDVYVVCPQCDKAVYGLARCQKCKDPDNIPIKSPFCPHCGEKQSW